MGIFAKRDIQKHEEITFNYNVDRYGYVLLINICVFSDRIVFTYSHQAQPCYCGESKCVGFIGGKTQTDIITLDDLYLDGLSSPQLFLIYLLTTPVALGITDEADILELKGTKKKRGKKIDDPDFVV
jgi:hypothetical protein